LGSGVLLTTTVADMSITAVDTALDRIAGTAPAGEVVTIKLWQLEGYHEALAVADGSGVFVATFSSADLRTRDPFRATVADAEGDESLLSSGAPFIDALVDPTSPWDCVMWRVDGPNLPVTLTFQTATGIYTRENPIPLSDVGNGGSACALIWGPGWGPIDFSPGDTITLRSPTWQGSLVLADVWWTVDVANEQINGTVPAGELEVTAHQWYGDRYPLNGSATQAVTVASPFAAELMGFDVRGGGSVEIRHFDPATGFATWLNGWRELSTPYFEVRLPNEVRGMRPSANEAVTATLYSADGTQLEAGSDDGADDPWHFSLNLDPQSIQVGQWVTVTSASGWSAGMQVPLLTVNVDEGTDLIWGEGPKGLVLVEHYRYSGEQLDTRFVPVDGYVLDRGYFGGDVQRGDQVNVIYETPSGNRISSGETWPWMFVTYDENRVGGAYALGHSLAITVTDSGGAVKATAAVTTSPGGAGPDGAWLQGFATQGGDWSPTQPDVQPTDWVHFQSDDGYTNSIQVGAITAVVDRDSNTVSGAMQAPGLGGEMLQCVTGTWGFTFRNFTVTLDAQGVGTYSVDFGPDQLPQDYDIIVQYLEPDEDRVGRYFRPSAGWGVFLPFVLVQN